MSNSCNPRTAAHQASLSFTITWSLLKLMSIQLEMSSNHCILCHPFLLLPSTFPCIRVFSSELAFHISWPKYWSFSFSISPNIYSGFPGDSEDKASARNAEVLGLIPRSGRFPGEGHGNPLQYSCLENPMDGGAWWATYIVYGVTESRT